MQFEYYYPNEFSVPYIMTIFRSVFSDFAVKYSKDDRYRNIEKMRDREHMFSEYIQEIKKNEKEKDRLAKDKVNLSLQKP